MMDQNGACCGGFFCRGLRGLALSLAVSALMLLSATGSAQRVLVEWNFPVNSADAIADGGITANTNQALITEGGTGTNQFTAPGATTKSASANGWASGENVKYWRAGFSTAGYTSMTLSSKQRSTATGPKNFKVQYQVDAGGWFDLDAGRVVCDTNFTVGVLDNHPLPEACENRTFVEIRWIMANNVSVNDTTVVGTGFSNIDDIMVRGVRVEVPAPQARKATIVGASRFVANWMPVEDVTGYQLDVATSPLFTGGFSGDPPTNVAVWTFEVSNRFASIGAETNLNREVERETIGSYTFPQGSGGAGSLAVSSDNWTNGTDTKYWVLDFSSIGFGNLNLSSRQRASSAGPKYFKVQYRIGESGGWADIPDAEVTTADNFTSGVLNAVPLPAVCDDQSLVFLRWIMTRSTSVVNGTVGAAGTSRIDDIVIIGEPMFSGENPYVRGYQSRASIGTHEELSGLQKGTYYYRVRAVDGETVSANSSAIRVRVSDADPGFLFFTQ